MEAFDQPESRRARDLNNVFPFLVPLQDVLRYSRQLPDQRAMFIYLPHVNTVLVYI